MTLTPGTRMWDSLSSAAWPRQVTRNHVNQWTESDSDDTRALMLICFCLLDFLPHSAFHAVKIYKIVSSGATALVVWEIGGVGCSHLHHSVVLWPGLLSLNVSVRVVSFIRNGNSTGDGRFSWFYPDVSFLSVCILTCQLALLDHFRK